MSYRGEGLPYIGVKLAKATLVPIARTCRYIVLSDVCSIHFLVARATINCSFQFHQQQIQLQTEQHKIEFETIQ
ncbi:unnamed protein product [Rotaria socialis]